MNDTMQEQLQEWEEEQIQQALRKNLTVAVSVWVDEHPNGKSLKPYIINRQITLRPDGTWTFKS